MVGRIFRNLLGNKLGYLEILRTHNFDLARVERSRDHPLRWFANL